MRRTHRWSRPWSLLAAITVVLGFLGPQLGGFLGHEIPWPAIVMAAVSSVVTLSGLALGWWVYGRRSVVLNTRTLKNRAGYLYDALVMKLYFDITYERLIVRPYMRRGGAACRLRHASRRRRRSMAWRPAGAG